METNQNPRFALRKLSVGVCSVMIGMAFYGVNTAQAAANDEPATPTTDTKAVAKATPDPAARQVTLAQPASTAPTTSSNAAKQPGPDSATPGKTTNDQSIAKDPASNSQGPTPTDGTTKMPTAAQPAPAKPTEQQTIADQYDVRYPGVGATLDHGFEPTKPIIPAGMPGTIEATKVNGPSWLWVGKNGTISANYIYGNDSQLGAHTYTIKLVFTADGSSKIVSGTIWVYPNVSPIESEWLGGSIYLHRTSGKAMQVSVRDTHPSFTLSQTDNDGQTYTETYQAQIDPTTGELIFVGASNGLVLHGITINWLADGVETSSGYGIFGHGMPDTSKQFNDNPTGTITFLPDLYHQKPNNITQYSDGYYVWFWENFDFDSLSHAWYIDPLTGQKIVGQVPGPESQTQGNAYPLLTDLNSFMSKDNVAFGIYVTMDGATAKEGLTATPGDDVPADPSAYLNLEDLAQTAHNFNGWHVTSVTWAEGHQPGANGKFDYGQNQGTAQINFSDGTHLDVPVTINCEQAVAYQSGVAGQNDQMNHYVTRTIIEKLPGQAQPTVVKQTVHFVRKDANGNAGYIPVGSTDTNWVDWTVAGSTTEKDGSWDKFTPQAVPNYNPSSNSVAQTTVTPDTPDTTVTINYTPATTTTNEEKPVTRTIIVHAPDGTVTTTQQVVTFTRTGTKNLVTGDLSWGNWHTTNAQWNEVVAPTYQGYTPSPAVVPAVAVDPATADQTVTISYQKVGQPTGPTTPGKGGTTGNQPGQPTGPTTPGQGGTMGNQPGQPGGVTVPGGQSGEAGQPGGIEVPGQSGTIGQQANGNQQPNGSASFTRPTQQGTPSATHQQRLPQTGNQAEPAGAIAGMALLTAALGLFGLKRKED